MPEDAFGNDMLSGMSDYSLICLWFIEAQRLMQLNDHIRRRKRAFAFMKRFAKEGFSSHPAITQQSQRRKRK